MKTLTLTFLVVALTCVALPASALNDTPVSNNALGWWPAVPEFGDGDYSGPSTTFVQQGYDFRYKKEGSSFVSHPQCTVQQLIDYMDDGCGAFFISTHGYTLGYLGAIYSLDTPGFNQRNADYTDLVNNYHLVSNVDIEKDTESFGYSIICHVPFVDRFHSYHGDNTSSFVYNSSCEGNAYASHWGCSAVLDYNYCVDNSVAISEATHIYNCMNGYGSNGVIDRAVGFAKNGQTTLLTGPGNWVLAPTISSFSPTYGYTFPDAGPYAVTANFDCSMKQNDPISLMYFEEGYIVPDNVIPGVLGPRWSGSSTYTANVVPLHCPAELNPQVVYLNAVSETGEHMLDGGWGNYRGQGPNRDNYTYDFFTSSSQKDCDVWATSFAYCGAFRDAGMTTFYWQAEFQRGTIGYDIYCGDGKTMTYARTVAPNITDPNHPQGYAVTFPATGNVVEIVERDSQGGETRSRPFPVANRPENFDSIVNVGNEYPNFTMNFSAPPSERQQHGGGGEEPLTGHPWYIFVSSRQDFLTACAPAINKLNAMGRPTQTLLTTKNPDDIWAAVRPYWLNWYSVRPRVILVGQAYQDTNDPRNILGTYYSPDSTGMCFFDGSCVHDSWIVDFDGDRIPDLPFGRIDADNITEVQNSVSTFVDILNTTHISSPKAFFLDGDLDMSCNVLSEPNATLQTIRGLYTSHGIPTTLVRDSQFADCYDLTARQNAAITAVQGGLTEMVGMGYLSTRRRSPALLIQSDFAPYWNMGLVPRQQRIIAVWSPGCDWGDGDRINTGGAPMCEMWPTANPSGTTVGFWTSNGRGTYGRANLILTREVMNWRFSAAVLDAYDVVFEAMRHLAAQQPGMIGYISTLHVYGWPVATPDMPQMPTPAGMAEPPSFKTDLLTAQPNPFTGETKLQYALASRGPIAIDIMDVSGRVVTRLAEGMQEAGTHSAVWLGTDHDGRRVAAGVYFVRAVLNGERRSGRMILMR